MMLFQFEKRNAPSAANLCNTVYLYCSHSSVESTMLLLQGKSLQTTFYAFVEP